MTWGVVSDVLAAELNSADTGNEKERAMYSNSKRVGTVALYAPSAEKSYLAMQDKHFPEIWTRRLRAFLDCFLAFCSLRERSFEMLK